jgi:hypothetical protein
MLCRYGSGLNRTVDVVCDGQSPNEAYRCPSMPRCAFWNDTTSSWSSVGCQTSVLPSGRAVDCKCNHLTTFSTTLDSTDWITAANTPALESGAVSSHWREVLMAALYLTVLAVLLDTRIRQARQNYAFLQ